MYGESIFYRRVNVYYIHMNLSRYYMRMWSRIYIITIIMIIIIIYLRIINSTLSFYSGCMQCLEIYVIAIHSQFVSTLYPSHRTTHIIKKLSALLSGGSSLRTLPSVYCTQRTHIHDIHSNTRYAHELENEKKNFFVVLRNFPNQITGLLSFFFFFFQF